METVNMNSGRPQMMNIRELNDDCLEIIIRQLSMRDQVRSSLTCERFRSIFKLCCKRVHKLVNLENMNEMTLLEINEFFKIAGPSIEVLLGADRCTIADRDCVVEFVSQNTPNIKKINLDKSKIKSNCVIVQLSDNGVLALKELPKLERLSLSENSKLTGRYLENLTNLRELNLYGCGNIQPTYFMEVCRSLKELHTLNMQGCDQISSAEEVFVTMQEHCCKLETLKISAFKVCYQHIARLPALKRLEIDDYRSVQPALFSALAQHLSNQLEYLKVESENSMNFESSKHISKLSKLKTLIFTFNVGVFDDCINSFCDLENLEEIVLRGCSKITNGAVLDLVRRCQKLKRVNVQYCKQINDQFVFDVIKILRQRKLERYQQSQDLKDPIIFFVHKSGISEFMINDRTYKNNSSNLKLSFYTKFNKYYYNVDGEKDVEYPDEGDDIDDDNDEFFEYDDDDFHDLSFTDELAHEYLIDSESDDDDLEQDINMSEHGDDNNEDMEADLREEMW